jgi:DNA-binding response OmpR family regulator
MPARTSFPLDAYRLDRRSSTAHVADALVKLMLREFAIAWLLFRHDGKYVSRRLIDGAVWNRSEHDVGRMLEQHIHRLRRKLALHGEHGVHLQTMYAHGVSDRSGRERYANLREPINWMSSQVPTRALCPRHPRRSSGMICPMTR